MALQAFSQSLARFAEIGCSLIILGVVKKKIGLSLHYFGGRVFLGPFFHFGVSVLPVALTVVDNAFVRLAVPAQWFGRDRLRICVAVRGRVGKFLAPSAWRLPRGVDAKKLALWRPLPYLDLTFFFYFSTEDELY